MPPWPKNATLTVRASVVPDPQYRDTIVIGGNTWKVLTGQQITGDGWTWEIPIIRDEKPRAF